MSRKLSETIKKTIAYNQKYSCKHCSCLLPPTFEVDHIVPHSISQDDEVSNLQALCPNCHALKTQREQLRIPQFKKLQKIKNQTLCWFCLEEINLKHNCDKKTKDIFKILKSLKEKEKPNIFSKFEFSKVLKEEKTLSIEICFYNFCIYVNNTIYKSNSQDLFVNDILEAIELGTRSKKYSKKFDTIQFKFIHKTDDVLETDNEACFDYIVDNIIDKLPERIFCVTEPVFVLE